VLWQSLTGALTIPGNRFNRDFRVFRELMLGRLRTYFLTGIVVAAPIAITIWLVWWFVSLIDGWIKPFIPSVYNPDNYLPFPVPGVGLVVALFVITVIGALAANLVGKTLINFGERTLDRMPVVRSVYKGVKQIFETALSSGSGNFSSVGVIGYPRPGVNVVVFIARELDSAEIGMAPGQRFYSAFMPTTPNPTSGFLFFVETKQVTILDITVEEAAKLVISAGLVTPQQLREAGATIAKEDDTISILTSSEAALEQQARRKPVTGNTRKVSTPPARKRKG
jgi:uncharacterized membrane protein